jgi:transcription antitermination factor NusG
VPWWVIRTKPNRESYAQKHLDLRLCSTYLPIYRNITTRRVEPLFPNYLFVEPDSSGQWRFLRSTFGVAGIILRGGAPDVMPNRFIDLLRGQERNGLVILDTEKFKLNSQVLVTSGAMTGHIGIYRGMSRKERCDVMFSMLGSQRLVSVPVQHLRPV